MREVWWLIWPSSSLACAICLILCLATPPISAWAFSLLGPSTPADGQGPDATFQPFESEFRWNINNLTYSFDDSFTQAFGALGVTAVRNAFNTWDNAFNPGSAPGSTETGWNETFDLESLALHELGHAMGLNHPDVGATFYRNFDSMGALKVPSGSEVMDSSFEPGEISRTLTADDLEGFRYLYDPDNVNALAPFVFGGAGDLDFFEEAGIAQQGTHAGANIDIFAEPGDDPVFADTDELAVAQIAWVFAAGTDGPGIINGNNIQGPADVLNTVAGVDIYFKIPEPIGAVPIPTSLLLMASALAGLFVFRRTPRSPH